MSSKPKTLSEFFKTQPIQSLALPSNLRYGHAIYNRNGIEFIEMSPQKVEAWVGGLQGHSADGGGQRRRVQLSITESGLHWHCAGNPKDHQIFCKHCVALALAIQSLSPAAERHGSRPGFVTAYVFTTIVLCL